MQLSPEHFAQLAGGPVPSPTDPPPGAERRQYPRLQLGKRAQIRMPGATWNTVVIRDMSVVGIGMLSEAALVPGQTFTLRVIGADDRPTCVECVVHRCERGGMGGVAFFVGSTFDDATETPAAGLPQVAAAAPRSRNCSGRIGRRAWWVPGPMRAAAGLFRRSARSRSS